jgi:pectate lyase
LLILDIDYYDGLIDITHASDFVTVSNSHLHDHFKASLVGHVDSNGVEDTGFLHVTYANNHFENLFSRGPSIRFGTAHVFNNYYTNCPDGINARMGAQVLAESNTWYQTKKPLYSTDAGYAVARGNNFGNGKDEALPGNFTKAPYACKVVNAPSVAPNSSGCTLSFSSS